MTATIAYDRPVKNLIDALSKTGHVTHTSYKKTSVTLHHNAGRLSLDGCLEVWKVRPASAHFDSDSKGALGQYVKVNEYAWAAGDGFGNRTSIHIEMANSATGGKWPVAEVTWKSAARLAGWLFAKVIGVRPSKSNLFYHHHWRNTACAGPYMDSVYSLVLLAAQQAYDYFTKSKPKPPAPAPIPVRSHKEAPEMQFYQITSTDSAVNAPVIASDGFQMRWLNPNGWAAIRASIKQQTGVAPASVPVKSLDGVAIFWVGPKPSATYPIPASVKVLP